MIKFFTSIKTSLWLMGISMVVYALGAFFIPQNLDVFSEINDMPLFTWFSRNREFAGTFFWICLLVAFMALLSINTIVCSIDALVRGLTRKRFVEVLSPQVLHLGVIFILFGHLVSAAAGYRQDVPMNLGETRQIRGFTIGVESVEFVQLKGEDSTRWRVGLKINDIRRVLEPARPAFFSHVGFFAKSAQQGKNKAIVGLVYDPGVFWEILGALVFFVGAGGLFSMQFQRR